MKLVGACADCGHWARRSGHDPNAAEFESVEDEAANRVAYEQWGYCAMASGEADGPRVVGTKAYAQDCESYKATLLTREDFGCVQWEPPPGDAVDPPAPDPGTPSTRD